MNTFKHATKIFVKDTVDLWKYEAKYVKNHWKGLVIVSGVVIGAEVGASYYQYKKWQSDMKREREKAEWERKKRAKEEKDKIKVEYEVR